MAVSKLQETLIDGLRCCGITQGAALAIMFMLETEEQQETMLNWMIEQDGPPTEEALLTKAVEITE